jgi:hypothetical protein
LNGLDNFPGSRRIRKLLISEYICEEKDRERWDAEDGYLVIDETESTEDIDEKHRRKVE